VKEMSFETQKDKEIGKIIEGLADLRRSSEMKKMTNLKT
jgi:hypothetical protein